MIHKLGCLKRTFLPHVPHYSALKMGAAQIIVPSQVNYAAGLPTDLGEMLNNQLGDCITEGTLVSASGIRGGHKARYHGPVVRLRTQSGKKLAVTPNHAVLTPHGFIRARHIKEGDYLVSASGPEILPRSSFQGSKSNLYQTPTAIEEIFASSTLGGIPVRKVMPVAIDFHGDEQFINGEVDVVRTDGFLGSELNSALGEPYSKHQISAAGKLQGRFHRAGSTFQRSLARFLSLFGDVSLGDLGSTLAYCHGGPSHPHDLGHFPRLMTGISDRLSESPSRNSKFSHERRHGLAGQVSLHSLFRNSIGINLSERATARTNFHASVTQPSVDGLMTDAHLFGDIRAAFPGLVHSDRVIEAKIDSFEGHIYDLSTESHWYIADGIITHNCAEAGIGHAEQVWSVAAGKPILTLPDSSIQSMYESQGYVSGDPSTDQGTVLQSLLTYLVQTGIPLADGSRQKLTAFVEIDPTNTADLKRAIYESAGIYIGMNVPRYAQGALDTLGSTLDVVAGGDQTLIGGHCVFVPGFLANGNWPFISYGCASYQMTQTYWAQNVTECYALVCDELVKATGVTLLGLSLDAWEAQMVALKGVALRRAA